MKSKLLRKRLLSTLKHWKHQLHSLMATVYQWTKN